MTSLNLRPSDSCLTEAIEITIYGLSAFPEGSKKRSSEMLGFGFELRDGSTVIWVIILDGSISYEVGHLLFLCLRNVSRAWFVGTPCAVKSSFFIFSFIFSRP